MTVPSKAWLNTYEQVCVPLRERERRYGSSPWPSESSALFGHLVSVLDPWHGGTTKFDSAAFAMAIIPSEELASVFWGSAGAADIPEEYPRTRFGLAAYIMHGEGTRMAAALRVAREHCLVRMAANAASASDVAIYVEANEVLADFERCGL